MPFGLWAWIGSKNHVLDGGPDPPMGMGNFEGKGCHCKVQGLTAVSCAKPAEPTDLPFGLWTRVNQRKHKFNHIRQVVPMFRTTLCRELCKKRLNRSNTTEPSVCSGDVAVCQITLTTLHQSTCVSWHPQLSTAGICESKVLLAKFHCSCCCQRAHTDWK